MGHWLSSTEAKLNMHLSYPAGLLTIEYDSDAEGFSVRSRLMRRRIPWDHFLAAGVLIQEAPNIPKGTPLTTIPGFGYLILKNNELLRTTRKVWISYRKGLGHHGVEALNIPLTHEGDAIVHEIRSHSPEWSEEPTRLLAIRKRFKVSNWWLWPVTIFFVLLIGILLLTALLAGAFLLASVQYLAIKFWWVLLFGLGFFWVYKKLKNPET